MSQIQQTILPFFQKRLQQSTTGTALLIFAICANLPIARAANPWVQAFAPVRTFYVSPTGAGSGSSPSDAIGLSAAITSARPGDLYWLLSGSYPGTFTLSNA